MSKGKSKRYRAISRSAKRCVERMLQPSEIAAAPLIETAPIDRVFLRDIEAHTSIAWSSPIECVMYMSIEATVTRGIYRFQKTYPLKISLSPAPRRETSDGAKLWDAASPSFEQNIGPSIALLADLLQQSPVDEEAWAAFTGGQCQKIAKCSSDPLFKGIPHLKDYEGVLQKELAGPVAAQIQKGEFLSHAEDLAFSLRDISVSAANFSITMTAGIDLYGEDRAMALVISTPYPVPYEDLFAPPGEALIDNARSFFVDAVPAAIGRSAERIPIGHFSMETCIRCARLHPKMRTIAAVSEAARSILGSKQIVKSKEGIARVDVLIPKSRILWKTEGNGAPSIRWIVGEDWDLGSLRDEDGALIIEDPYAESGRCAPPRTSLEYVQFCNALSRELKGTVLPPNTQMEYRDNGEFGEIAITGSFKVIAPPQVLPHEGETIEGYAERLLEWEKSVEAIVKERETAVQLDPGELAMLRFLQGGHARSETDILHTVKIPELTEQGKANVFRRLWRKSAYALGDYLCCSTYRNYYGTYQAYKVAPWVKKLDLSKVEPLPYPAELLPDMVPAYRKKFLTGLCADAKSQEELWSSFQLLQSIPKTVMSDILSSEQGQDYLRRFSGDDAEYVRMVCQRISKKLMPEASLEDLAASAETEEAQREVLTKLSELSKTKAAAFVKSEAGQTFLGGLCPVLHPEARDIILGLPGCKRYAKSMAI